MTQILYLNYKFWCWNQFWSSESPLNIIFEHANRYNSFFWKVLIINFFIMSSLSQNRKIHLLIFFSTIDKVMHIYCKKAVFREYLVFFRWKYANEKQRLSFDLFGTWIVALFLFFERLFWIQIFKIEYDLLLPKYYLQSQLKCFIIKITAVENLKINLQTHLFL